jgi:hypothetical protein
LRFLCVLMYCVLHKFNALYDGNWVRFLLLLLCENWKDELIFWANDVDHDDYEGFKVGKLKKMGVRCLNIWCCDWFLGVHGLNFYDFDWRWLSKSAQFKFSLSPLIPLPSRPPKNYKFPPDFSHQIEKCKKIRKQKSQK